MSRWVSLNARANSSASCRIRRDRRRAARRLVSLAGRCRWSAARRDPLRWVEGMGGLFRPAPSFGAHWWEPAGSWSAPTRGRTFFEVAVAPRPSAVDSSDSRPLVDASAPAPVPRRSASPGPGTPPRASGFRPHGCTARLRGSCLRCGRLHQGDGSSSSIHPTEGLAIPRPTPRIVNCRPGPPAG